MRVSRTVLCTSLAVLITATANAQPAPGGVTQVIRQKVAPNMVEKYEAGRKKHMEWHRQAGDPWGWTVGQITSGPDSGTYIIVTGSHQWQDFDTWGAKMGDADTADANVNLVPYAGESETSYWAIMPEYSRMPAAGTESPMATVTFFYVKPGGADAFLAVVKSVMDATTKAGWSRPSIWYTLANGGVGGTFAVVGPRKNMADMASPSPSLTEIVEQRMGKAAADAMWKSFSDSLRYTETEMIQWRPDLSYQPVAR